MLEKLDRIDKYLDLMGKYGNEQLTKLLDECDFFTTPASLNYHGQHDGGLIDHSYEVTISLLKLTKQLNLHWELERSPYVVGMFHDLCKVDNYVKSEDEEWGYNPAQILTGHGEKSVTLTQNLFIQCGLKPLTFEEQMCIRWHMGAFDEAKNQKCYCLACREYHNVLYTHTADMIASQIIGV